MRAVAFGIALALLTGCVAGRHYVPASPLVSHSTEPAAMRAAFEDAVRACWAVPSEDGFQASMHLTPLIMASLLGLHYREYVQACMEKRGWRVAEPPKQ